MRVLNESRVRLSVLAVLVGFAVLTASAEQGSEGSEAIKTAELRPE